MGQVKLLITDFDGTLVDTFEANYLAYQKAFSECCLHLSLKQYKECFGLRFDDFMNAMRIADEDTQKNIKRLKGEFYPLFFEKMRVNKSLLEMLRSFKQSGGMTALASTARRSNLINALNYLGIMDVFTFVIAGEDVEYGKPNPEIYHKVLEHLNVLPNEALVFEDSEVGINAARNAEINYIIINNRYFKNELV